MSTYRLRLIQHFDEIYSLQCNAVTGDTRQRGYRWQSYKKYTQVAAELNISVSAVERLISRALIKLRVELKEDWLLDP